MSIINLMDQEVLATTESVVDVVEIESSEEYDTAALDQFNLLMAQSGDEIVESPRLPGVPLALRTLMEACPEPVTAKNAHKFLAEAHALLNAARAKKLEKAEEEKEDSETENEIDAKKKPK